MATLKYKNGSSWTTVLSSPKNATIGNITASVDANTGTPGLTLTSTTSSTSTTTTYNFDFAFKNVKGAKGSTGGTGAAGNAGNFLGGISRTNSAATNLTVNSASLYFSRLNVNTNVWYWNYSSYFSVGAGYIGLTTGGSTCYYILQGNIGIEDVGWAGEIRVVYAMLGLQSGSAASTTAISGANQIGKVEIGSPMYHSNFIAYFPPKFYQTSTASYLKLGAHQTTAGDTGKVLANGAIMTAMRVA